MNFYMTHREDRLGQRCKRKSVGGCAEWCCQKHHSEWEDGIRAAGYKAGVLAGLERACYLLGAWPRYRLLDELLKTMAHLERTGKLPKGG